MNEQETIKKFLESEINLFNGCNIGLSGTLGAGKTQFVKNLLKTVEAEFENQVQSPTFNICNVYTAGVITIHHYDMYRVESEDELYEIEIFESIDNSKVTTFIEWIDRFPELIEICDLVLSIQIGHDEKRIYKIEKNR